MSPRIADRLLRARASRMVGREAEMSLLRSALDAEELPFLLLFLHGPRGVGKSTLLRSYASLCQESDLTVHVLDGRHMEATPDGFTAALRGLLHLEPEADPVAGLAAEGKRQILLLDTYEEIQSLDNWLRDSFLPELPADCLTVIASAQPPAAAWRTDPGWQDLVRSHALRNLSPADSAHYLLLRGVPEAQHRAILDFTHGYPLALSLVADVVAQREAGADGSNSGAAVGAFEPESSPYVVQTLLEQFVAATPTPAHQIALEVAAMVRITTEPLLAEMLAGISGKGSVSDGSTDTHDLFRWLYSLSFMEACRQGIFPHDVAREALLADLRWRNRERYAELHRRARTCYQTRLSEQAGDEAEEERTLFDYLFLHRDNPVVRAGFDWHEAALPARPDILRPGDTEEIVRLVARHEGELSAGFARQWLNAQPDNVIVFRDPAGSRTVEGFLLQVALQRAAPAERDADPATAAAWRYLSHQAPLRPGEDATHLRFWMARDTYHAVSPLQSQIAVRAVRHYLTFRGLAFSFFPVTNPAHWMPLFTYAEMERLPDTDYSLDGRYYAVFGHDWRVMPPADWLACLGEKEISASAAVAAAASLARPPRRETLVVLGETEFAEAVKNALRHYNDPNAFASNPLLRSRLVADHVQVRARTTAPANDPASGGNPPPDSPSPRVAALRALLQEAIDRLQEHPRWNRGHRPLIVTYLRPALSQERAAEVLGLPFSTYRRHLAEGIAEVTRILWRREIAEPEDHSYGSQNAK